MTRRDQVKRALRAVGLDRAVSRARYLGRLVINRVFRQAEIAAHRDYRAWKQHAATLQPSLVPAGTRPRRALLVTKGTVVGAKIETGLIKGLELGGFAPAVLTDRELAKFFRVAGVREIAHWDQFIESIDDKAAEALVAKAERVEDLLPFEFAGARVGKFALSTAFRALRTGRLDFSRPVTKATVLEHLRAGMARASAAHRLLDRLKPELVVFMGNRYTGHGELMDVCVDRGIDVLAWFDAHRSSSLMLKRYNRSNRDQHHASLSDETWARLLDTPWTEPARAELRKELSVSYAAGDWYSRGGTQVGKSIVAEDALRARLRLAPGKKTAVIFPHIVWDATLFWGRDLFPNYEDWLVETVRAAYANTSVNWIIKIHPAHVAKGAMERYDGEAAEITAIRTRVGPCPPHVTIVEPDTDINTYSLFSVMDYCLTVRGTIGVEAACQGIRVLTAGTGRYDHRGFTTDSETPQEYLARLASIETLPRLSARERNLAERFAHGAFVLRPWPLTSLSIVHEKDVEATTRVFLNARSSAELRTAPDLLALGAWAADGAEEDFLWRRPGRDAEERTA